MWSPRQGSFHASAFSGPARSSRSPSLPYPCPGAFGQLTAGVVLLELHLKGVRSVREVSLKKKTCHQEALQSFLTRCLIHWVINRVSCLHSTFSKPDICLCVAEIHPAYESYHPWKLSRREVQGAIWSQSTCAAWPLHVLFQQLSARQPWTKHPTCHHTGKAVSLMYKDCCLWLTPVDSLLFWWLPFHVLSPFSSLNPLLFPPHSPSHPQHPPQAMSRAGASTPGKCLLGSTAKPLVHLRCQWAPYSARPELAARGTELRLAQPWDGCGCHCHSGRTHQVPSRKPS